MAEDQKTLGKTLKDLTKEIGQENRRAKSEKLLSAVKNSIENLTNNNFSNSAELKNALDMIDEKLGHSNKAQRTIAGKQLKQLEQLVRDSEETLKLETKSENMLGPKIQVLADEIKETQKVLSSNDDIKQVDKTLKSLEGGIFTEQSKNFEKLNEQFGEVVSILSNPDSTNEQILLAREQLEVLKANTTTEEQNRENTKRQEEANTRLGKMVAGLDGLGDKYDKMLDNLKPSAGLFATVGGLALLFTDPETLFKGVRAAVDGVFAIVESIEHLLNLEIKEAFSTLYDNLGSVSAILGVVAFLFGGRIIRGVQSLLKGVLGVVRAVKVFRVFMLGTFVPGMIATFSAMAASLAPILVAAAPFIAIGALVAAGMYAIYEAFKKAKATFDDTGSITETMVTFATDLVTAPIRWIKNLSAWVLSKLGFEELATKLNNIDITKTITDTVMGTINWVKELFTNPVAALDKLAMALIGPDGILGVITAPIDKAINWVMGLFKLGDPSRPFSLYDTLYDPIDKTITWLKGLFTDPVAALQQAWNGLVGEGGLIDIIYSPIDKAIAWIQGLFGWGNPEEPFKLSTVVKDAFKLAKDWIVGLFTWGSEAGTGEDGTWSLSTFIPNAFADVKTWFLEKLAFASDMATEGWTNLKDFVSGLWTSVKTWITDKLTWASDLATEGWTSLSAFVSGKWTATKTWFEDMFTWSSNEEDKGVIQTLFDGTIEKIKTFFTSLFDFIPSFEEIKSVLTNILPSWMRPEAVEETRRDLQEQIRVQQAEIESGDNYNWRGKSRQEIIKELQNELNSLPQANMGGIINAPKSGTPVMLHGQEIVAPLNSPQGKVLTAINDLMNAKAASGTGEYGSPAAAIVMGGNSNKSNTNNVNTTNYTIQQGVTPDDFLKRDFINFSY